MVHIMSAIDRLSISFAEKEDSTLTINALVSATGCGHDFRLSNLCLDHLLPSRLRTPHTGLSMKPITNVLHTFLFSLRCFSLLFNVHEWSRLGLWSEVVIIILHRATNRWVGIFTWVMVVVALMSSKCCALFMRYDRFTVRKIWNKLRPHNLPWSFFIRW